MNEQNFPTVKAHLLCTRVCEWVNEWVWVSMSIEDVGGMGYKNRAVVMVLYAEKRTMEMQTKHTQTHKYWLSGRIYKVGIFVIDEI